MQTIATKYHGPTDTRGSRITATATGGSRTTVPYDHAQNMEQNHRGAMIALLEKLDWRGTLYGGHTQDGMVWVFADQENKVTRS